MIKKYFLPMFILLFLCTGCAVSNKHYDPNHKFTKASLQKDFTLLRNILEVKHPALYWYTPKDSMNFYFDSLYNNIADSMTELQFGWKIIAPLTQKIHCGHTSFNMSTHWDKFMRNRTIPCFPLYLKVWGKGDTMVVLGNLNKNDSVLKRGTIITSINGMDSKEIVKNLFAYLPLDGYANNVNYIRISSNFPYYHRNVFGLYKNYRVTFIDPLGNEKPMLVPMYSPPIDTSDKKKEPPPGDGISRKEIKKERIEMYRSLTIDTAISTAILTLNTFDNGGGKHLRHFIKKSFKTMQKGHIKNLILDLRSNGGGDINLSALLTKYLRNSAFKVSDSAYAISTSVRPFTKYIRQGMLNNIGLLFVTKKRTDGNYHFGYWERHLFHPKIKNHFNGKVYVLTNGLTFSASTIFCNAVKSEKNITLAGEETGGGWYGNSGLLIPDITLPITKLRVRLPFFKIVQFNHIANKGSGVMPDIFIPPTVEGIRRSRDSKMEMVKGFIKSSNAGLQVDVK